jgi:hypothetical protein
MALIILLSCLLASGLTAETSQKFLYKADDNITIEPNSTITLTL